MHALLSVIGVLIIVGLPACLWWVVRRPRRRRRLVQAQLGAPIVREQSPITIGVNRRTAAFVAVGSGALTINWLVWLAIPGTKWPLSVDLLLIAVGAVVCRNATRRALRRQPVLVLDDAGITLVTAERTIPWNVVDEVSIVEQHGTFGVSRFVLVCDLLHPLAGASTRSPEEMVWSITVPVENLSMSWKSIALAVQARLGKHVLLRQNPA